MMYDVFTEHRVKVVDINRYPVVISIVSDVVLARMTLDTKNVSKCAKSHICDHVVWNKDIVNEK
jgi:hypothetical protein